MDSVRTSQKTLSISFIKGEQLILCIFCLFCDTESTITICGLKAELLNLIRVGS